MESFPSPALDAPPDPSMFRWSFVAPTGWSRTDDPVSGVWGELFDEQAVAHGPRGSGFYLRGSLAIPVLDKGPDVVLTVWVSLSGDDFQRAHLLWDEPRRVDEPPYLARLCNRVPGYPDTWHLPALLHTQAVGVRPVVHLEAADHPLVTDQRHGITRARALVIADAFEAVASTPVH
jgi:hypothetical protein